MQHFELAPLAGLPSGQLPGGYKQRLAMAAALLHEPEILFLDEPTSGADPLARREFWQRITALAEQGVTVIVTTHFMEEAEYCDRVVILDSGRVLAQGTPAEIRRHATPQPGQTPTMEDAFIAIVHERGRREAATGAGRPGRPGTESSVTHRNGCQSPPRHVFAKLLAHLGAGHARNIARSSATRAASRIGVVMPVLLILLFGYGLSLDVKDVPVAIVMEQPSPDAMELAARFQLSPYFDARLLTSMKEAEDTMLAREVDGIVRIRSDFARNLAAIDAAVQILVHGTDANRARIIQGYAQAAVAQWRPCGWRKGQARRRRSGRHARSAVVQRGQRQPLFPRARTGRSGHDADRRHADVPGHGPRMGTRHAGSAVRHAGRRPTKSCSARRFRISCWACSDWLCACWPAKFLFHVPFRGSVVVLAGVSMLYLLVALGSRPADFHPRPRASSSPSS